MNPGIRFRAIFAAAVAVALWLTAPGRVRAAEMLTTFPAFGSGQYAAAPDPAGTLVLAADGNFYGSYNNGTGFQLTPAGVLTVLPPIDIAPDEPPSGLSLAPDGNSYGLTPKNIDAGVYEIIRLTPDGTLTTVCSFSGGSYADGSNVVQGADGSFYGTTYYGGVYGFGAIFQISPDRTMTVLHSFDGTDGKNLSAGLIQTSDGSFYGTARNGGSSNDGTVYRLTPDGTLTVLHNFNKTDGSRPCATLLLATDGNFYGTTAGGGTGPAGQGGGTVFRMTPDGTLTTLHSFSGEDGSSPTGALIEGSDGNFYGTTPQGGSYMGINSKDYSKGTVFQMTPDGTLTTLRFFDRLDGCSPNSALVREDDGTIYGTTAGLDGSDGGMLVPGSIFRLSVVNPARVPTLTAEVVFPVAVANEDGNIPIFGGIVLTLSSPATKAIEVKYTISGSAVPGVDYEALSGKVKFKPGQTGAAINIVPNFNVDRSNSRKIKIKLQPGGAYDLTTPGPVKIKVFPSD